MKIPMETFHIGIYIGESRMLQTFHNSSLQINKVDFENKRIIGYYRIKEGGKKWA